MRFNKLCNLFQELCVINLRLKVRIVFLKKEKQFGFDAQIVLKQ